VPETKEGLNLAQRWSSCQNQTITGNGRITLGKFASVDARESEMVFIRKHERTGRPIGDDSFIERLDRLLGRELKLKRPGPKAIDKSAVARIPPQFPGVKKDH
jgi:hypothetical protein